MRKSGWTILCLTGNFEILVVPTTITYMKYDLIFQIYLRVSLHRDDDICFKGYTQIYKKWLSQGWD